jgi:hypothetical protein
MIQALPSDGMNAVRPAGKLLPPKERWIDQHSLRQNRFGTAYILPLLIAKILALTVKANDYRNANI